MNRGSAPLDQAFSLGLGVISLEEPAKEAPFPGPQKPHSQKLKNRDAF